MAEKQQRICKNQKEKTKKKTTKLPADNQSIEKRNESINLNKLTHALANNTCKQIT